jgi:hypothetical protein
LAAGEQTDGWVKPTMMNITDVVLYAIALAFVRNSQATSADAFVQALAAAGVQADTPATVLCDGDAGLWRLQREALPAATVVLDWWHVAIRFEHGLQTARGLGVGAVDADLVDETVHSLERAKRRCGTAGGSGAGANLPACTAGRSASRCVR